MRLLILCSLVMVKMAYATSIDWCEYWARMGKKTARPECAGYTLPADVKRTDTVVQCPKNEMYHCIDCEPTCNNLVPKCRKVRSFTTIFTIKDTRVQRSVKVHPKEQCSRGCICKTGYARNSTGKCVQYRECLHHHPPGVHNESVKEEEDGTVMKTVKKMVPVIVNDVWKAFFNSIKAPEEQATKQLELKPVDVSNSTEIIQGTEIANEHKQIFQNN